MPTIETKELIREALMDNLKTNRKELAIKHGVSLRKVGAVYASIKRKINKNAKKGKISNNTYTNHDGVNKDEARTKMANAIIDSGLNGNILTLPNITWAIENMIRKELNGVSFTAVEKDRNTFLQMRRIGKKLGFDFVAKFGEANEFIYGKVENSYSHLILDYCGELPTHAKEIEYALNNNIVRVGGIIAVTTVRQIRGSKNTLIGERILSLASENNSDFRCDSIRSAEAYFNKITGWNYSVKFFYYQDKGHTPMMLAIIKRLA